MSFTVSDRLKPFVDQGIVCPAKGYHATLSYPTVQVGSYIEPWKKVKRWSRALRKADQHWPGVSHEHLTYFSAGEVHLPYDPNYDVRAGAWGWAPAEFGPWHEVLAVVEPVGIVDIDDNTWYPEEFLFNGPKKAVPNPALTAERLLITDIISD